jgi:2'-5' RNA ligase
MSSLLDRELSDSWRRTPGIFVVCEIGGTAGGRIHEIQRAYDPKLASFLPPHLTLVGSSGAGPIASDTPVETLRSALEPISSTTPPLTLTFQAPLRFMQTDIVVLPFDPHGPLRELHERILRAKLTFQRTRFAFTPHVTLSFYRTLTATQRRELLALRIDDEIIIDNIRCSVTDEPQPPRDLLTLPLTGAESPRTPSQSVPESGT